MMDTTAFFAAVLRCRRSRDPALFERRIAADGRRLRGSGMSGRRWHCGGARGARLTDRVSRLDVPAGPRCWNGREVVGTGEPVARAPAAGRLRQAAYKIARAGTLFCQSAPPDA